MSIWLILHRSQELLQPDTESEHSLAGWLAGKPERGDGFHVQNRGEAMVLVSVSQLHAGARFRSGKRNLSLC